MFLEKQPEPSATAPERAIGASLIASLAPAFLAVAWLVFKARWIWNHRPEMQFGWIVLLLCAYVFWERWDDEDRPPPTMQLGPWNVAGFFGGLALLFLVQIYQAFFGMNAMSLFGHFFATMAVVFANLHYVFSWPGIRRFGFAFGFLFIAMPMPSIIQNSLTSNLQSLVAVLNVEVLNLLGIPARKIGSLIQLPGGTVGVDEACSGIRSLQSAVMATLFIGYVCLRHVSLQVVLFAAGCGFALAGNLIRSLYLSYTAHTRGVAALDQVHDTAGWMILLFTATGVGSLAWALGRVEKGGIRPDEARGKA